MNKSWYKFLLNEDEDEDPYLPGQTKYISVRQLEKLFKVFHLSSQRLSKQTDKTFTFTPRVPSGPMTAEDNFTKRISLAPNINRAIFSLTSKPAKYQKGETYFKNSYDVYAGDLKFDPTDDIPTIKLNVELKRCNKDLTYTTRSGKTMKYTDYRWYMPGFIDSLKRKEFGVNDCGDIVDDNLRRKCFKDLPISAIDPLDLENHGREDLRDKFYACVPDANRTREEWSLDPVTLYYIGRLDVNKQLIRVNVGVLNLIKSKLKNRKIKEKSLLNLTDY